MLSAFGASTGDTGPAAAGVVWGVGRDPTLPDPLLPFLPGELPLLVPDADADQGVAVRLGF